jgi:hypothetical protein
LIHRSARFLRIAAAFALTLWLGAASFARDPELLVWKPVDGVQLKLADRPLKIWNVYQPEKKKNLVLVLLSRRYLMMDLKARTVYEVDPTILTHSGDDLRSDDPTVTGKLIPTSEWYSRDVGPAQMIRVKLGDYGAVLEIALPHMEDLRRGF